MCYIWFYLSNSYVRYPYSGLDAIYNGIQRSNVTGGCVDALEAMDSA